jgi:hypothetical protein
MSALPPPPVSFSASLAPTLGQQVLPASVQDAYRQTWVAWGGATVAVVHTTGKPLPPGLQAMVARHNPALARSLMAPGHTDKNRGQPAPAALLRALQAADGRILDQLVAGGWLAVRPELHEDRPMGDQDSYTENQWDRLGTAAIHMAVSPAPFPGDPVLFRWVTVCHEAAHVDLARRADAPFHLNAWSPAQNAAMNRLLFWQEDTQVRGVFEEGYADAYGVLMALRVTQGAAMPAAQTLLTQREANARKEQALSTAFDPHDTEVGLGQVLAAVKSGQVEVQTMSPAQLRAVAREAASANLVAFLSSPAQTVHPAWAWAKDAPATDEARREIEGERVQAYLADRQEAYFLATSLQEVAPPQPGSDPVLQAIAQQDADFASQYWALPEALRTQMKAAYLMGDASMASEQAQEELIALTNGMANAAAEAIADDGLWNRLTRQVSADHATVQVALAASLGKPAMEQVATVNDRLRYRR